MQHWYREIVPWFGFVFIVLLILEWFFRITVKIRAAFAPRPSVEANVQVLMADAVNFNADPTRPTERYAATNEYLQHRRRG